MKKLFIITVITGLVITTMISAVFFTNNGIESKEPAVTVRWYTFDEAVALNAKSPKKIFIDVYTDWCGWCKKMDAGTFNNPTVAAYLNEKYYPVKFNAEQREDITFKNYTFKFIPQGRRGYHQLAASLLDNKLSYPTVVFLDEDFNMIQPLPGYRAANAMYPILEYFGDDHYRNGITWQDFQKSYKSPF